MMAKIKRYELTECGSMAEDEIGFYILASDIDADKLQTAITCVDLVLFHPTGKPTQNAIEVREHLSALLAAVRKQ